MLFQEGYFTYTNFKILFIVYIILRSKLPGEQQREFSTLSTITEKKDNYIEIPTRSFDIEEPEEDSEEFRHRLL